MSLAVRCDGDPTKIKLLALSIAAFTFMLLLSDVSDATEDDIYWCYGDNIVLEYDGEAEEVNWTVIAPNGTVLQKVSGSLLSIDASGYDELIVTQEVVADQGSSLKTVKIRPLHQNAMSVQVRFFDGETPHDIKAIDSTTVCKNNVFVELPEEPSKAGLKFGGWVYGDGTPFAVDGPIVSDLDVFAKWLRSCSILLMSDGDVYMNLTAFEGDSLDLPVPDSDDGRSFVGWGIDRQSESAFDRTEPVTGDMVLYAMWSETPKEASSHADLLSMFVLVPLAVFLAVFLYSRLHRSRVRITPGSAKGRFGGR